MCVSQIRAVSSGLLQYWQLSTRYTPDVFLPYSKSLRLDVPQEILYRISTLTEPLN